MKKYLTFIFDLDGTLLDTITDLTNSVNYALSLEDLPNYNNDIIKSFLGNGMEYLIEKAVPNGKANPLFNKIYQNFKEYYMIHATDYTLPYDGIIEVLDYLKKNKFKMAIVSNKGYDAVTKLNKQFFSDYIDVAIGEKSDIRKKPYPDTVYEAMRLLSAEFMSTLYIGDSEVDIQTAKNANIPCLSVAWGFRSKEQLEKASAQKIILNVNELLDFLKYNNSL